MKDYHNNMILTEKKTRANLISIKTKEAMSKISDEQMKEMMDKKKETFMNRTPERKEYFRAKNNWYHEGSGNGNAKKYVIYNENNVIMFEAHGNLKEVIKENNLPYALFNPDNRGKQIYMKNQVQRKYAKYKGWKTVEII